MQGSKWVRKISCFIFGLLSPWLATYSLKHIHMAGLIFDAHPCLRLRMGYIFSEALNIPNCLEQSTPNFMPDSKRTAIKITTTMTARSLLVRGRNSELDGRPDVPECRAVGEDFALILLARNTSLEMMNRIMTDEAYDEYRVCMNNSTSMKPEPA